MTRILTIMLLLAGLSMQAFASHHNQDSKPEDSAYMALAGKADSLMQAADWAAAAECYREAMRSEPGNGLNPLLMCNLGMCLNEAGDASGAIIALSDARRMMPSSITAALNRAQVFRSAGMYAEAFADLSDALAIDSTLVEARLIHGMIALRTDSMDIARRDFTILSHLPGEAAHLAAATGNAMLFMALGEYTQAIPPLSTLIEKDPADVDWLSRRALCRLLTADPAGASEDIADAMRFAPEDGELFLYRAMLGKLRFRNEEAKYDARHAITLGIDPDHVEAMLKLVE